MRKYVFSEADVAPRPLAGTGTAALGRIHDLCTEQTVGAESLVVSLAIFAPGYATVGHGAHADREHAYYILSGKMTVVIDGVEDVVSPGEIVFFPRGIVHDTRNDGAEELRLLIMRTVVRSGPTPPVPRRP